MGFEQKLGAFADQVDQRMSELLPPSSLEPPILSEAMRYAALGPGKRIRPALCLAAAEAVGAESASALDMACGIEFVHCFSLIHDDLPAIDDDDLRRGRASCHVQFGEAIAILAGDALFSLAFDVMSQTNPRVPELRHLMCLREVTRAVGVRGLVGGEASDILAEGQRIGLDDLESIHRRKTASLIAAACRIGGICGGGSDPEIKALGFYGEQVGLAFQIVDDILNETSTPEELGKSAGSDRDRQKATYPSILGLDGSRQLAEQLVQNALDSLAELSGTIEFLRDLARFSVRRAS